MNTAFQPAVPTAPRVDGPGLDDLPFFYDAPTGTRCWTGPRHLHYALVAGQLQPAPCPSMRRPWWRRKRRGGSNA